jgi:hypothetical protein
LHNARDGQEQDLHKVIKVLSAEPPAAGFAITLHLVHGSSLHRTSACSAKMFGRYVH